MDAFDQRFKTLTHQAKLIRDCREIEYEIFDETEQCALKSFQKWNEGRRVLTVRQIKWLVAMHTKACAYDERGGN